LWSAAHYRAKVVFVVFNNRRYGVLQNVARSLGYANAVAGRFVGMETLDPPIDFAALAASMGTPYAKAGTRDEIAAAFAAAMGRDGPTLIEIPIA
jgi:benzoylformate decarboxylase